MLNGLVNHAFHFLLQHINKTNGSTTYFVILYPYYHVFESNDFQLGAIMSGTVFFILKILLCVGP